MLFPFIKYVYKSKLSRQIFVMEKADDSKQVSFQINFNFQEIELSL